MLEFALAVQVTLAAPESGTDTHVLERLVAVGRRRRGGVEVVLVVLVQTEQVVVEARLGGGQRRVPVLVAP